MTSISSNIQALRATIPPYVTLVCVSKFHSVEAIQEAYDCGERDFGESRVQELVAKHEALPKDIRWHFIGHLQTNKVKQIVPFVHLIQSVDSWHLLEVINAEAAKVGRVVNVLLEVHVAKEATKTGFDINDLIKLSTNKLDGYSTLYTLNSQLNLDHVQICGLMAMATNTDDETEIRRCFKEVKSLNSKLSTEGRNETATLHSKLYTLNSNIPILSIGMSDDYLIAIEEGSTMVRIGSSIFGERN
ncbi:MAG: YggS family pyridoxal phosphate-dependent enzyme [Paludibacteraceae bacterium]|nr:YggS family pyridoxal phosphate-dependent enzyme [Paludibacteraceae bacterium]